MIFICRISIPRSKSVQSRPLPEPPKPVEIPFEKLSIEFKKEPLGQVCIIGTCHRHVVGSLVVLNVCSHDAVLTFIKM